MSRAVLLRRNDITFGYLWVKHLRSGTRLAASAISLSRPDAARLGSRLPCRRSLAIVPTHRFRQDHAASTNVASPSASTDTNQIDIIPPPDGSLAIVFTDIVKSTYIWERSPSAMQQAMILHDDMIRSLTTHHRGYEVKQNGDGFMIAFQTAIAALEFCLDAQKKLLEIEWPEELLELGAGSEVKRKPDSPTAPIEDVEDSTVNGVDEDVLWRGLRLRMSAHFGEPVCNWNSVIDRMDYLGPMVNRAARFIQVTEGGQVVVSEEFLDELQRAKGQNPNTNSNSNSNSNTSGTNPQGDGPLFVAGTKPPTSESEATAFDLKDLPHEDAAGALAERQFEVRLLGKRHFKGLGEMQKLYFIIPASLRGRMEFWPRHMHVPGSKGNLVG